MTNNSIIQRGFPCIPGNVNQILKTYGPFDIDAKHYVMWSGGCDSTLLLYELAEAYGPENVVAVSYKYPWLLSAKYESEAAHRTAIRTKLIVRDSKYKKLTHLEFNVNITNVSSPDETPQIRGGGQPQAVAWLLSVPIYGNDGCYFYNGAVRCDDLTLFLEDYHKIFESVARTLDRKIYLREPYLFLSKAQVIEKLFNYDLYDVTWFCEMPHTVGVPCYDCTPCRTHLAALSELSHGPKDSMVTMQATKELQRFLSDKQRLTETSSDHNVTL